MNRILGAALAAAVVAAGAAAAAPARTVHRAGASAIVAPRVQTSGTAFVDARGSRVYLRGFDAVGYPAAAADLGANFVRLPVYWSELEPTPPVDGYHFWDQTALEELDARVAAFAARGISVLLDLHQSGWSSYFDTVTLNGHGIPSWFYSPGFFPFLPTARGLAAARADFFTNPATVPYYQAVLDLLVRRFRTSPYVIGYELFNEPPAGGLGQTHEATEAIVAWEAKMLHFVRTLDPVRTVFLFVRQGGDLGFLNADLSAFAPLTDVAIDLHDYFVGLDPPYGYSDDTESWSPSWTATHVQFETAYGGTLDNQLRLLDQVLATTNAWHVPLLVGEWGARYDDPGLLRYQADMLAAFRARRLSWARWMLTGGGFLRLLEPDGSYTDAARQIQEDLRRPY